MRLTLVPPVSLHQITQRSPADVFPGTRRKASIPYQRNAVDECLAELLESTSPNCLAGY